MIKVRRLDEPAVLLREAGRWTEELCTSRREYYRALSELDTGLPASEPTYPRAKKSRYAYREIKSRLEEMFGAKCAYCESRVPPAVSYQHVEHFRPQSIYPLLAYEWSNLLLACQPCNSAYKRQQFPLMDGSQPEEDRGDPCSRSDDDDRALVDPCRDEPTDFFAFDGATLVCLNWRAEQTRDVCGLDREGLNEERRWWLTVAVDTAAKAYQVAEDNELAAEKREFGQRLRQLLGAGMPYVAMTRARLDAMGIDPDTL